MVVRTACYSFRMLARGYSNLPVYEQLKHSQLPYQNPMKKIMTFEKYKQTHIESFEKYKNSPTIQLLAKGDFLKVERAYKAFCRSQYEAYKHEQMGGNPSEMV